jgi:hypothetical protein
MSSTTGSVASFISAAASLASDSYIISDTATAIVGNLNTIVANQSKVHQLNIILSGDDTSTGSLRSDATITYYALSAYTGQINLTLSYVNHGTTINNYCQGSGVYQSGLEMLNQLLTTYTNWTITPFVWNPGTSVVNLYKYADINSKLLSAMTLASGLGTISVQADTLSAYNIVHYYNSPFYRNFANAFGFLNGTLSDSALNIQTNLDALSASPFQPSGVTFTDISTPTISVSQSQLSLDSRIISGFSGSFNLNVTGVTVQSLSAVLANTKVTTAQVIDTAADIQGDLLTSASALNSNISKISGIQISDHLVINVSSSLAASESQVLSMIVAGGGSYQVTQNNASVTGAVASFLANPTNLQNGSYTIVDTAAHIASGIDQLQSNNVKIAKIVVSDGAVVLVNATQATSDLQILNLITNNGGQYGVSQIGATGNVSSFLSGLNQINSYTITDTSANVASHIDVLNTNLSKITAINLSDNSPLSITANQFNSDAGLLSKLSSGYKLNISGAPVASLNSLITNANISSFSLTDTASSLASNLDSIQASISKITSLIVSDNQVLLLSQTQATSDAQALALISSGGGSFIVSQTPTSWSVAGFLSALASIGSNKLSISDTVANIGTNLDTLQTNIGKISAITVNGTGTFALSQARATADAPLLTMFTAGGGKYYIVKPALTGTIANFLAGLSSIASSSYAIVDTAVNISAALDSIQNNLFKVASISTTDANACTVTQAQVVNDAQALSLLIASGGNYLTNGATSNSGVSGFLAVASSLSSNSYSLLDSSINLANSFDQLQLYATKLSAVAVSDTNAIIISVQQFINDSSVVKLIVGRSTLNVTGLNASNALATLSNTRVVNAVVSDSSQHISAILDSLQADILQIKSIVITDSTPLTVTQIQSVTDAQILALIQAGGGSFKIGASSNTGGVANFLQQAPWLASSSYNLLDTASNISNYFDGLNAYASKLSGIYTADGLPITLSDTQFKNDQTIIGLLGAKSTLKLNAVPVVEISKIAALPNLLSLNVSDTAQNIGLYLDGIQSNINKINSISLSDGKPLIVTQAQVGSDPLAISLLTNSGINVQTVATTVTIPSSGFYSALPNQIINGIKGLSTVSFVSPFSNFGLSLNAANAVLTDNSGIYGKITLNNVDRLTFSDGSQVALDLQPNQDAFNAIIASSTVFGVNSMQKNFSYFVSLFDQGNSVSNVSAQITASNLIENILSISTANTYLNDKAWVDYVYLNVVGINPNFSSEQYYVNFLISGTLNKNDLLNIAMTYASNPSGYVPTQLNLVGIQHQGFSFTPLPTHG